LFKEKQALDVPVCRNMPKHASDIHVTTLAHKYDITKLHCSVGIRPTFQYKQTSEGDVIASDYNELHAVKIQFSITMKQS
jgi:hypothetical protein